MKRVIVIIFLLVLMGFTTMSALAQCPMRKTSVESSLKDKNNTRGRGLNNGILYLLSVPYLAVGVAGVAWYIHGKKKRAA